MTVIEVNAERKYPVVFSSNYQKELEEIVGDSGAVIIVPQELKHFAASLPAHWERIFVPSGEQQKDGTHYLALLNELAQRGMTRSVKVVAIGGGATTDLAGFVAATFLRGVDWIAVPTSLAGMVDASIGGKTGINLAVGKNLAGAFHSPQAVIIDTSFLETLPLRDMQAGMAEVVKCGFIADSQIIKLVDGNWIHRIDELIARAVQVKANVVSQDFKESDLREILNYGHTLGHAIEKHSKYSMRHGECVAIGMVFAAELSKQVCQLSPTVVDMHLDILAALNLPTRYHQSAWPELFEIMQSDKKIRKNGVRFVTLSEIGKPTRAENIPESLLADIYGQKIGE